MSKVLTSVKVEPDVYSVQAKYNTHKVSFARPS